MVSVWFLWVTLTAVVSQSSAQWYGRPHLSAVERYLYVQLEDALVNDAATLEQLREVFFQEPRPNEIHFHINITADTIPASTCGSECPKSCEPAFCPVNKTGDSYTSVAQWELCSGMNVTWKVLASDVDAVDLIQVLANTVVPWCTHGLSLVVFMTLYHYVQYKDSYYYGSNAFSDREPIKLLVKLDCHPFEHQLIAAVGELFSWIETYTAAGGKPLTWDPKQQAFVVITTYHTSASWGAYWLFGGIPWQQTVEVLNTYGLVGCLLLKLSLFLLIPRLFLGYHNKIVRTITRPGPRSLYWGTAVVSLFLVTMIMLFKLIFSSLPFFYTSYFYVIPNLTLEFLIPIAFLIISIIASRKSRAVPIPAANFTTHVLFCFCCCLGCSSRYKSKGVLALTLWAFMMYIYYNITEAVALLFTLFISVPLTVSYALVYISGVFFAIMFVSIILFSCQSTSRSQSTLTIFLVVVDVFTALLSVSFIIYILIAFIAMSPLFGFLKVKGFEEVVLKFSVLPSLALSVAGWFIRKKLLKEDSRTVQPAHPTDHEATGHSLNDGEMEDEEEQSPEEQQHLLA